MIRREPFACSAAGLPGFVDEELAGEPWLYQGRLLLRLLSDSLLRQHIINRTFPTFVPFLIGKFAPPRVSKT